MRRSAVPPPPFLNAGSFSAWSRTAAAARSFAFRRLLDYAAPYLNAPVTVSPAGGLLEQPRILGYACGTHITFCLPAAGFSSADSRFIPFVFFSFTEPYAAFCCWIAYGLGLTLAAAAVLVMPYGLYRRNNIPFCFLLLPLPPAAAAPPARLRLPFRF